MILRPRQKLFCDRARAQLKERKNTLAVAPTGAGKTVMLCSIVDYAGGERALVLQHRDELVRQNRKTFHRVHRGAMTGVVDGQDKQFQHAVTFAMVQTLARETTLARLKPVDVLAVDECHHIAAGSWLKIVDHCRLLNPDVRILGLTATPDRGDKKSLRVVFDNVADQITLGELIAAGNLVPPRTFVLDLGVQGALAGVKKTTSDFDMDAVAEIMDKSPLNSEVVRHWKEKAGNRRTVVFTSTTAHAAHVVEAFRAAGVTAEAVGESTPNRADIMARFERGAFQVIVNVAVLTEGWDCQPVSCVVLLRPSSHKSTMMQMIGRGLRPVDPELFPGTLKDDCIVLDFGTSTLQHGSLEMEANLAEPKEKKEAPTKDCPECNAVVPMFARFCALCSYEFPGLDRGDAEAGEKDVLKDFHMVEIDLLKASPYRWIDIWEDGSILVASAFDSWAIVVWYFGRWVAIGGAKEVGMKTLSATTERTIALAGADDFLREHGDTASAAKSKRWLNQPASVKQLAVLGMGPMDGLGMNSYTAACKITWKFNERGIRSRLESAASTNSSSPSA